MEVLSGLIGAAFVFLAIVSIVLYLDTRGNRKALDAWRKATDKRLAGHDEQLATLGRAVTLLVPEDARPTTAHKPALTLARSVVIPDAPSPGNETAPPRSGRRETPAPDSPPPVTRPSVAPGDARAARTTSSRPPPPVEVVVGREAQPPPQPERVTLTPTDPSTYTLDARIERRWHELVETALAAGKDARHCHGRDCMQTGEGIDRCACTCDSCGTVLDLLIQARTDVIGEDW